MADNKLELVVEVDTNRANASIKSVNAGLSRMEQTAAKAARGASAGIDGMTASMVKGATAGNLLAEGIKKAVEWAKNWTVEAAKMAAHESRMEASGRALAKAHGIAAEAFEKSVEGVRKIGYHGEDAIHTIDRLIIADLDLSKATGLAKVAKDAAAIENIEAPEALEKILQAIEFGNARALRSAGLVVNFEREITTQELRLGRALSDNEKAQARYNAIIKAAAAIQGAHAGAVGEAEMQMKALDREVHELREAVGVQFQDHFKAVLALLRDLVGFLRDNASWLVKFGEAALYVSAALATAALVSKIQGITGAVQGLTAALAANPWALMLTGIAAGGAIVYKTWKDTQARLQERWDEEKRAALREDLFSGKTSVEVLRKQGMTDDQIRELVSGSKAMPGQGFEYQGPELAIDTGPDLEALKLAAELRKKQAQVEQESRQAAAAAGAKGQLGFARDIAEVNAQVEKWTDEGKIQLTRQAWVNVIDQLERRWGAYKRNLSEENQKYLADYLKDEEEAAAKRMEYEAQVYQRRLQYDAEWSQKAMESARDLLAYQEEAAGINRDARLRAVEATDAQTLRQKLAVEQQKMQIEVDYLERVHEIKLRLFDLETSQQAIEYEVDMKRLGYEVDVIGQRIAEYSQQRDEIRRNMETTTDAAVQAARENEAIRQGQLIRDEQRRIFDSLKQQAGGVFDALLQKSQSVWSAIGNSLKTAILTAIKDVVTSRVAAMLMQLFAGTKVGFEQGGTGGGAVGRLGGLLGLGAVPVFGGGAVPDLGGFGIPGAPGGTGGFSGPVSMGGSLGAGGAPWANLGATGANYLANLKSFLGVGGSVQLGPGMATTWQAATMGQKLSAIGHSNAALMGGGLLAMDGLRRGGTLGLAETTAGGALVGFKYGGPLGAAMGAGIGAAAGLVRLFVKGAQEKAREKIKALYGVDISDKGVLKQIVETAKQAFGGNLDVAIRSQQVRDLVELYAMSAGQRMTGGPAGMRPGSLVQTGGSLFESPSYQNGSTQPTSGALRVLGGGTASSAAPQPIVLKLDGPATTLLLRGEAVQAMADNPRAVQGAAMKATKANAGRREMLSLQLSPGTLTA
jgi:hypothetical protein